MTDKELLELAAKAVYYEVLTEWADFVVKKNERDNYPHAWNPLTDDGDALRLAVKLDLTLYLGEVLRVDYCLKDLPTTPFYEKKGDDPYAATRRAIVRAAAEIGKSL